MDVDRDESLYRRVENLELAVRRLRNDVDAIASSPTTALADRDGVTTHRRQAPQRPHSSRAGGRRTSLNTEAPGEAVLGSRPRKQARPRAERSQPRTSNALVDLFAAHSETLLNRIGIGLLLLGVAFLFKYSIDQGWVTEPIRIVFGIGLGVYLLITGVRLARRRPSLAPVLCGGGTAILYGTVYVAHSLYGLIDAQAGFYYMVGITVLAFLLSVYQDESSLSVIATIGGLATPFLIPASEPSLAALATYVSLIVAGTTATYMYRGWRLPLIVAAASVWPVLVTPLWLELVDVQRLDRLAYLGAAIVYWMSIGWCPVIRDVLEYRLPNRWRSSRDGGELTNRPALVLSASTPLVVLSLVAWTFTWNPEVFGWIAVGMAAAYGATSFVFASQADSAPKRATIGSGMIGLAQSHRLAAAILFTVGLLLIYQGSWLLLILTIEAAVLSLAARLLRDRVLEGAGILMFVITLMVMLTQLSNRIPELPAVIHVQSIGQIIMIGVYAACAWFLTSGTNRPAALGAVHVLFLVWILVEIGALPDGQALVTVAWGSYAIMLFILGFRASGDMLRTTGLATLLLAVCKLLVIDLAALDAVWRILLFLAFGGGLLVLSYYVPDLWRATAIDEQEPAAETAGVS